MEQKNLVTSFDGCPVTTEEGDQYFRLMNDEYGMTDMKSDRDNNLNVQDEEDDEEEHHLRSIGLDEIDEDKVNPDHTNKYIDQIAVDKVKEI